MKTLEYKVKTPVFEGPLDLLLDLVSKRKLFVNDISLAAVTNDFLDYLKKHEEFPLDESAEFIVVAATLMLIKSRSLLPQLDLTEEEEESIQDLERRLVLYARAKELAAMLKSIFGKRIIFEKEQNRNPVIVFSPDSKTNPVNLLSTLRHLIETLPEKDILPKAAVRKIVSLEETIERLVKRVSKEMGLKFRDFAGESKMSVIVGFLALLELVKRGVVQANQEGRGEIEMYV